MSSCADATDMLVYLAASGNLCYSGPLTAGMCVSDVQANVLKGGSNPGMTVKLFFDMRLLNDCEELVPLKIEGRPLVLQCVKEQHPFVGCMVRAHECVLGRWSGKDVEMTAGAGAIVECISDSDMKVEVSGGRMWIAKEQWSKLQVVEATTPKMGFGDTVTAGVEFKDANGNQIHQGDTGVVIDVQPETVVVMFRDFSMKIDDFHKLTLVRKGWEFFDLVEALESAQELTLRHLRSGTYVQELTPGTRGYVKAIVQRGEESYYEVRCTAWGRVLLVAIKDIARFNIVSRGPGVEDRVRCRHTVANMKTGQTGVITKKSELWVEVQIDATGEKASGIPWRSLEVLRRTDSGS